VIAVLLVGLSLARPAWSQSRFQGSLDHARQLAMELNWEGAIPELDRVVDTVRPLIQQQPALRTVLTEALELRARCHYHLGHKDTAREDFKAVLALDVDHHLSSDPQPSPALVAFFNAVANSCVGLMNVQVDPFDAKLELDDRPFDQPGRPAKVFVGEHRLAAARPGYRREERAVNVTLGSIEMVTITLARSGANVRIFTVPAGVEVIVDGKSRGVTLPGPPAPEDWDFVKAKGFTPADVSAPLLVGNLPLGRHPLVLKRDCYKILDSLEYPINELKDYKDVIRLSSTAASVSVGTAAPGAEVWVDGVSKGIAPLTLSEVCPGSHRLEVRSPSGRYWEELQVKPNDKISRAAPVRPAVAVLSYWNMPEQRGAIDPRVNIVQKLGDTQTATFLPMIDDKSAALMTGEQLLPGWLAFNSRGEAVGPRSKTIAPQGFRDISARLAHDLGVQGVAEVVGVPNEDGRRVWLTLLAGGSGRPDALEIDLSSKDSVTAARQRLDMVLALIRRTLGVVLVDVVDVTGAVVAAVEPGSDAATAGVTPGDVLTRVESDSVPSASALPDLLLRRKVGTPVLAVLQNPQGAERSVTLTVMAAQRPISADDQTLLFNKVILDLRIRLAKPDPDDEPALRLNLAIAEMAVLNYDDAVVQIQKVELPSGGGVGYGTVQYLLGECYRQLSKQAAAEAAWGAAAADPNARLTEDGPFIRDLLKSRKQCP
jgi:hypothetical protein